MLSLLKRIRQSDESAFPLLVQMYDGMIESAVRSFSASFEIIQGDADSMYGPEDLRQDAMVALYRAAETYDEQEKGRKVSFGLYAKICVNNALISALRKFKSEKKRRETAIDADKREKASHDPLDSIISEENKGELLRQLSCVLSGYEKKVFEYFIIGKTVHEIAERLGKDEKSVSNAVYRIKSKIKGLLKNQ